MCLAGRVSRAPHSSSFAEALTGWAAPATDHFSGVHDAIVTAICLHTGLYDGAWMDPRSFNRIDSPGEARGHPLRLDVGLRIRVRPGIEKRSLSHSGVGKPLEFFPMPAIKNARLRIGRPKHRPDLV